MPPLSAGEGAVERLRVPPNPNPDPKQGCYLLCKAACVALSAEVHMHMYTHTHMYTRTHM